MEQEERKNILNRQYTTLVLHYINYKGQPAEMKLINSEGWIHYGKPCVDSCHWEYRSYNNLIFDLENQRGPEEIRRALFVKKRLFSKKKDIYETCSSSWEDRKIDKKSFVKLVFNQEYKETKDVTLKTVTQQLPVEELFLFAKDHCEDLRYYNKLEDYVNNKINEETAALKEMNKAMEDLLLSVCRESGFYPKTDDLLDVRAK